MNIGYGQVPTNIGPGQGEVWSGPKPINPDRSQAIAYGDPNFNIQPPPKPNEGVTDIPYTGIMGRINPNTPVATGHNDIYNPGGALTPINPNGYRGYNPGQTVPGLMRGLAGGQTGIGVSQGYGGAQMPNTGGYAQAAGGQGTGIQKQLTAIQQALTGQGGMGV